MNGSTIELSTGPWDAPSETCDLVMKGGITSGVVYPGAVLKLAERYRFQNIGGASAGAIAAAVTAAAEYGRHQGGFAHLRKLATAIAAPGFVLERFQPRPELSRAFDLALQAATSEAKGLARLRAVAEDILWRRRVPIAVAITLWLAASAATAYAFLVWMGWWAAIPWVLLLAVAGLGVGVIVFLGLALSVGPPARSVKHELELNGFGMCPGTTQPGFTVPALSDWLHEQIQACAGRTTADPPVTFADLEERGGDGRISFQLVTTDLSAGRPVRLPLAEPGTSDNPYLFDPDELSHVIPAAVVEWMREQAGGPEMIGGRTLYRVPGAGMPILLATRLSLSFPVLLTAVRFHTRNEKAPGGRVEHWLSDGGISSNFPIHFFDSLLPGHPTFGLDLMGVPDEALAATVSDDSPDPTLRYVYLPSGPTDPVPIRWSRVDGLLGFFKQVFDSARNWRDTMQMELPGFHERICHIRLHPSEGGLNLRMEADVVARLVTRGAQAGASFDAFEFDKHRFTRYLTLMQQLEVQLKRTRDRFGYDRDDGDEARWFRARLLAGLGDEAYPWSTVNNPDWCRQAAAATQALLDAAAAWGAPEPPPSLGFDREGQTPTPQPTIRVTPQI